MNFARRMFRLPEKREVLELNVDDRRVLEVLGIHTGDVNVRGKNALKVDTVFSCVRIRSESVAKLPLKVFREDESGIQKQTRHPAFQLLRLRPNPYMSAYDFWKCIEAQNDLYGNAYASIEFDKRGRIVGLWPMDSSRVKIVVDNDTSASGVVTNRSKLWYEVNLGYEQRKIMPHELLHFKGGVTLDGIVGLSPLDCLRATLENGASANRFINNFYKQGLQVKGVVQYVGDLDEKAKRNFREKFESMSSGLNNSHRIALLPIGYQFKEIALNMHDAQFLENNQLTIRQIASAFGIKMHQLNDLSRATHTNVAEQQKEFYTDTLQPILTMYEQELTYKLLLHDEIRDGYFFRFNADAILRSDIKTRYEAYRIGVQGGFLAPNEARAKEELPPLEGGDQLLVNGSMVPITDAGKAYQGKGGGGAGTGEKDDSDEGDPGASS
ncbi:phage portal protein [Brevibacillus agri]|uniref:phage portal protein n=2 Tax=Brevibacillus agri TaxID=51101 RepID=UPI002E2222DE|nr:phage portal protein [Brevibacillus agri]MED1642152.1 phage portal protein [Brevibacillus agri]MED1654433.1 phage portal protein [Brevibacillus agri]MED1688116.1 phage portal protein [Brevibacillus agri]MED1691154.1 phage portal protein [Brevibacillus agri]MED1699390.1 phage portal protein [Brevibacillus agri]